MSEPLTRRPHILFITSDQHRGDAFGFEGSQVRTPHLDLLARQGTRFATCITPNVVCQPARASILTGLLPLTHGVHDNGIDLDEAMADRGFAATLSRAGYHTHFIGKAHFSTYHTHEPTSRPENIAGSARYDDSWSGPYMGFDAVELMLIGHNHWLPERAPRGMHYERWYHRDGLGDWKDSLYRARGTPDVSAAQTHHSLLPTAYHNSTWVADRAIELLNARRHTDQPFCAWVSFPDPHHPFDAPEPWGRLYEPQAMKLPVHRVRDFERRPWWHRAAMETQPAMAGEMGRVRREYSRMGPHTDQQLGEIIANHHGMVSLLDHNVGRILARLADTGLDQNTLVVFTSDHGEWLGDHGLMLKGPMFYEGLLRVGLILRGPGVPAGQVVTDPVSTLDLADTFVKLGAAQRPAGGHGRDLMPLVRGQERRAFARSEWRLGPARCGVKLDLHAVRTANAKLTLERYSGAGEMYCLDDDPHEMHNRFDDPAFKGVRDELMDMLESRPKDIMDPLPEPIGAA